MLHSKSSLKATSKTYKHIALLLIMAVFSGFAVLSLYNIERKVLVFFARDTDNQAFSIFCTCIVLWCCYGVFRVFNPKDKRAAENPDPLIFKQYGSRFRIKGKSVFAIFILLLLFIMIVGTHNILLGHTTPKVTSSIKALLLSLLLISICSLAIFACFKAAFYEYAVRIDPLREYVTHKRSFLFWSSTITYHYEDIQYVIPSQRKFVNKYLSVSTSYGGKHNKTQAFYIYIKPYNAKPILFLESPSWPKVEQKTRELAQLFDCGVKTPDFTNLLKGYW